jgi:2-desacetyl-2-hydroxyethyl bacteriochlorophyllide A dehydrogenase
MKAVRTLGASPHLVDVENPKGEGVLVKVASVRICGSDLHLLAWTLPVTLGHEIAGTTPNGTPVGIEPISPCGQCAECERGDYNRCPTAVGACIGVGADGGMAEFCMVPESALVPLPKGVTTRDGCLVEPLAVGIHGVRLGGVQQTMRVGVIGAGAVGLCGALAASMSARTVSVFARHDAQREAVERLGFHHLLPDEDAPFDVVIEAAGNSAALAQAVRCAKPGGAVIALGTYWDQQTVLPGFEMSMKEVRLIPASFYSRTSARRDIEVAVTLLANRKEIASTLITHRLPLDSVQSAFAIAKERRDGAIKVVLEP